MYTPKAEAHTPMVSTEAMFLTAMIDTMEGRTVAVVDIPSAFIQADMDKLVHVHSTGEMVHLLLDCVIRDDVH